MTIRFLPTYIGSKRFWLKYPQVNALKGRNFIEPFAGSGVLSANLAHRAILNDIDPMVSKILTHFDKQIVPEVFTRQMYYEVRRYPDWWQWAYCLLSISFSGVFRYAKNGFNTPAKGGPDPTKNKTNAWDFRESYSAALARWKELGPLVTTEHYENISLDLLDDPVIVFDPPFEGSKAPYNKTFDYHRYWSIVHRAIAANYSVLVFDRVANLQAQGLPIHGIRKMRVNGSRPGDEEGMFILT